VSGNRPVVTETDIFQHRVRTSRIFISRNIIVKHLCSCSVLADVKSAKSCVIVIFY
jgi:hypothetical protein